ncbi:QCR6-1 [Scenedesmus sp. PABB004]|nr:QCR6-1 [Scenedesmus sp. PABB004]
MAAAARRGGGALASSMVEYTEDDPKPQLEDECKVDCLKEWHNYQECAKRIESSDHDDAHCTGWAFDYWKCVDKCVAPKLFKLLK